NSSSVKEFIFLGLSENQEVQKIYFVMFLLFYTLTVAGNLIVLTVMSSRHLNSPMYFFLCHLSFVDVCYSSVTAPQMISGF
ncbi:OR4X2 protein, partial [Tichodroma muraria]|nr:OR4X2 protein [Tichodroma muraria]